MTPAAARAARAAWVAALEWSEDELEVLRRAEVLRNHGLNARAAYVVAHGVVLPRRFLHRDVVAARRLDVGRWYAAFTGARWDGLVASFAAARAAANQRGRRRRTVVDVPARDTPAAHPFRHAHLVVEPASDAAS